MSTQPSASQDVAPRAQSPLVELLIVAAPVVMTMASYTVMQLSLIHI